MSAAYELGFAVVIGVDDYAAPVPKLPVVVNDVRELKKVLTDPQRCGYLEENVRLLSGPEATKQNILARLDWLRDRVEGNEEATAIIYYSGHGHVVEETGKYYLIPYDYEGEEKIEESAIKAEIFSNRVDGIKAPRKLVLLDCCHAAGIEGSRETYSAEEEKKGIGDVGHIGGKAAFPIEIMGMEHAGAYVGEPGEKSLADHRTEKGSAVLNSSSAEQKSYIRKDRLMSHFTYQLIKSLTGHASHPDDDEVLVTDVMSWVWREVPPAVMNDFNKEQTPVMRTEGVFPVALLIGGKGVTKGIEDGKPPEPPMPEADPSVTVQVDLAQGSLVTGSVNTGGGDLAVGDIHKGDNIKEQTNIKFDQRDTEIGQQFNLGDVDSFEFTGGDKFEVGEIHNSQGLLFGRVSADIVKIGAMPAADDTQKQQIEQLVAELNKLLQKVPQEQQKSANAVTKITESLIENASAEEPNEIVVESLSDSLKRAAQAFRENIPEIVDVTTKIAAAAAAVMAAAG